MGFVAAVNSRCYAEIDEDACISCAACANERCQVNAIEEGDESYRVVKEKCIGCGLCITTCPTEAIHLVRKSIEQLVPSAKNEQAWFDERARSRGVDYSAYR